MLNQEKILQVQNNIKKKSPLIHCITNPISMNNCANVILATGAKPIMAEHPLEVGSITSLSQCLLLNLGTISDLKMKSMRISSKLANGLKIPIVLDLVGVGVSQLRMDFAREIIDQHKPQVIKGNISEIRTFCQLDSNPIGIDAGKIDELSQANLKESIDMAKNLSKKNQAIVLISGCQDILTDSKTTYLVKNGSQHLANITGTGCMLTALVAAFISCGDYLDSSLMALLTMTISGELANAQLGYGSFFIDLIDKISTMDPARIIKYADYIEI